MLLQAFVYILCVDRHCSKVPRPDKLALHVFEVDEDVDKDEVSLISMIPNYRNYNSYYFHANVIKKK